MSLLSLFKKKPKKLPESERLMAELGRVSAVEPDWSDMSEEERASVSFTPSEKKEMYAARQDLRFIPPVGKNGGLIQSIANEINGVSRQYIHQVFYPKNPNKLFSGRSSTQKKAWQLLVQKVKSHPLLPKYKQVFEGLMSGQTVNVTISVSKFRWIRKKSTELVPGLVIVESNETVPTTYTLIPPRGT